MTKTIRTPHKCHIQVVGIACIVWPPSDDKTLPTASPRYLKIIKHDAPHLVNNSMTPSNDAISLLQTREKRALCLQMYSRDLRNVITPRQKTANVIIEQDSHQKVAFLQKDNKFFVTLNDWPWQWKHTEPIEHWHVRYEIWELNSHGSAFSVPNPRGPLKSPFGFALQTWCVCV